MKIYDVNALIITNPVKNPRFMEQKSNQVLPKKFTSVGPLKTINTEVSIAEADAVSKGLPDIYQRQCPDCGADLRAHSSTTIANEHLEKMRLDVDTILPHHPGDKLVRQLELDGRVQDGQIKIFPLVRVFRASDLN